MPSKRCTKCGMTKPVTEFVRHRGERDGRYSRCKSCKAEDAKQYRGKNLGLVRSRSRHWYSDNQAKAQKQARTWKAAHPGRMAALWKQWATNNRQHLADYRKRNAWRTLAHVRARQVAQITSTPKWANRFFMKEAYHLAMLRTKMLGFRWDVDHIVPIRSRLVCGLHVENNLQVIPMLANRQKGNKRWPDMPDLPQAWQAR